MNVDYDDLLTILNSYFIINLILTTPYEKRKNKYPKMKKWNTEVI